MDLLGFLDGSAVVLFGRVEVRACLRSTLMWASHLPCFQSARFSRSLALDATEAVGAARVPLARRANEKIAWASMVNGSERIVILYVNGKKEKGEKR